LYFLGCHGSSSFVVSLFFQSNWVTQTLLSLFSSSYLFLPLVSSCPPFRFVSPKTRFTISFGKCSRIEVAYLSSFPRLVSWLAFFPLFLMSPTAESPKCSCFSFQKYQYFTDLVGFSWGFYKVFVASSLSGSRDILLLSFLRPILESDPPELI